MQLSRSEAIIGVIGSIASVIGLAFAFWPRETLSPAPDEPSTEGYAGRHTINASGNVTIHYGRNSTTLFLAKLDQAVQAASKPAGDEALSNAAENVLRETIQQQLKGTINVLEEARGSEGESAANLVRQGKFAEAEAILRESILLYLTQGNAEQAANALGSLATIRDLLQDKETASIYRERARDLKEPAVTSKRLVDREFGSKASSSVAEEYDIPTEFDSSIFRDQSRMAMLYNRSYQNTEVDLAFSVYVFALLKEFTSEQVLDHAPRCMPLVAKLIDHSKPNETQEILIQHLHESRSESELDFAYRFADYQVSQDFGRRDAYNAINQYGCNSEVIKTIIGNAVDFIKQRRNDGA